LHRDLAKSPIKIAGDGALRKRTPKPTHLDLQLQPTS
jgi:hypothetical protein